MPTEQDKDAEILKLKEIIIGQSKVILEYQKLCFKQLTGREFVDTFENSQNPVTK